MFGRVGHHVLQGKIVETGASKMVFDNFNSCCRLGFLHIFTISTTVPHLFGDFFPVKNFHIFRRRRQSLVHFGTVFAGNLILTIVSSTIDRYNIGVERASATHFFTFFLRFKAKNKPLLLIYCKFFVFLQIIILDLQYKKEYTEVNGKSS